MTHANENSRDKAIYKERVLLPLLALGLMVGSNALAHGGGLNAEGCHNNRKTGDYHCHRVQQTPDPTQSQLVANEPGSSSKLQPLFIQPQARQLQTNGSGRPTCYTGPRGGTYTLTASGNKNYSGC